jgi:alpha-methylacyl-CoA racemase
MAGGPLSGMRVLEFSALGPAPFCGMLLADLGADVVRIDRPDAEAKAFLPSGLMLTGRGKQSVVLDLKKPAAIEACLELCKAADVLIEGFRPGVMERLGLGPEPALACNPKLVYGRMTGWGQTGPLAQAAGHDINYISLSGALAAIGTAERPVPPLNLLGDYGGGSLYLAMGVLAAVIHARASGQGQVVDAAMVDGSASLMTVFHGFASAGQWRTDRREANLLDGGTPFYGVYQCADGEWISLGPLEPPFWAALLALLDGEGLEARRDPSTWPEMRRRLTEIFASKPRSAWCELLEGTDACFAPVLRFDEAHEHPHNRERGVFVEVGGVRQPAPAPRFSETPGAVRAPPPKLGEHTRGALAAWGLSAAAIDAACTD